MLKENGICNSEYLLAVRANNNTKRISYEKNKVGTNCEGVGYRDIGIEFDILKCSPDIVIEKKDVSEEIEYAKIIDLDDVPY